MPLSKRMMSPALCWAFLYLALGNFVFGIASLVEKISNVPISLFTVGGDKIFQV